MSICHLQRTESKGLKQLRNIFGKKKKKNMQSQYVVTDKIKILRTLMLAFGFMA